MFFKNMHKKKGILFFILAVFLIQFVSAELEIEKKDISSVVIKELPNAASFELTITNLGESDIFEIYSLVGIEITPKENFSISSGETKTIAIQANPEDSLKRKSEETFPFVFKIRGEKTGVQEDSLIIKFVKFEDALEITQDSINPDSSVMKIKIKNKENFDFQNLNVNVQSIFFDYGQEITLLPNAEFEMGVPLDREKLKTTIAGSYMITAKIKKGDVEAEFENFFKLLEKSGLSTSEEKSGLIFRKKVIEKTNEGNVQSLAEVNLRKDIISRLVSTFSPEPDKIERKGFFVYYTWQEELKPAETFRVTVRTNWLFPLLLLLIVVVFIFFVRIYTASSVILEKRARFVKTKGGEFALKIVLSVKAREFVEKVRIIDRVSSGLELYEKSLKVEPDRIDSKNKRLEWNIENLNTGEKRVFSYIVFSKVAPIGRIGLSKALSIYEANGKIHETESNKVFLLNEQREKQE